MLKDELKNMDFETIVSLSKEIKARWNNGRWKLNKNCLKLYKKYSGTEVPICQSPTSVDSFEKCILNELIKRI